jgi:hypothetical protein
VHTPEAVPPRQDISNELRGATLFHIEAVLTAFDKTGDSISDAKLPLLHNAESQSVPMAGIGLGHPKADGREYPPLRT